jgi:membrane protein
MTSAEYVPGEGSGAARENVSAVGKFARIVWLSGIVLGRENGPYWAAAIAYFSLMSFFPLLLATASIGTYIVGADRAVEQAMSVVDDFIPQGAGAVEQVIREAIDARGTVGIVSLLLLLWSGSRVFGVVTRALNVAFQVPRNYPWHKRIVVEITMLLTIGVLFVLAFASRWVIGLIMQYGNFLPEERGLLFRALTAMVPVGLLFVALGLTYRFVPRQDVSWKAALAGAAVAVLLFFVAQPLFLGYMGDIASMNFIYGSLAVVVILVVWTWMVSLIVLFGGSLAARLQSVYIEGQPIDDLTAQAHGHSDESRMDNRQPERLRQQDGDGALRLPAHNPRPPGSSRPGRVHGWLRKGIRATSGLGIFVLVVVVWGVVQRVRGGS